MNKAFAKVIASTILIGLLTTGILTGGGCNMRQNFYQKRSITSEDLLKRWGRPVSIRKVNDNTEIYVFRNQDTYSRYRNFTVKDNIVVDEGFGM